MFGRRDPDARGYFGAYGGRFVPETLVAPIEELTAGYFAARADTGFRDELDRLLRHCFSVLCANGQARNSYENAKKYFLLYGSISLQFLRSILIKRFCRHRRTFIYHINFYLIGIE